MEQRAVICFFTLKRLKASSIQTELKSVYGPEAVALLIGKKWRTRFHQRRTNLFEDPRSGSPLTNGLVGAIGSRLEEWPFSSCEVLCRHFQIEKSTCLRILHDKGGSKKIHLRRVPHARSIN
jgi:hypothetical protein